MTQASTTTMSRAAGAAVPRKKARGGQVAIGRTKVATTIKGGREAEALKEKADDTGIDDDKVVSCGRRRPPQEGEGRRGGRRPHEGGRDHLGQT